MIATITLNPSLDEHIVVDGLMVEETNRWVRRYRYAGGKGIDVSRAVYEMGGITVAYGFIGGLDGRALEILLDEERKLKALEERYIKEKKEKRIKENAHKFIR